MRLYLGRQADQLCSQLASGAFKLPGKSLISCYNLSLDVAYTRVVSSFFCKVLKDAIAGNDFVMYLLTDSSPRVAGIGSCRSSM